MAIKRHMEDGVSYAKVLKEFGIHKQMIIKGYKKYRVLGKNALNEQRGTLKSPLGGRTVTRYITKDQEILKLKAENEYLKNLLQLGRK